MPKLFRLMSNLIGSVTQLTYRCLVSVNLKTISSDKDILMCTHRNVHWLPMHCYTIWKPSCFWEALWTKVMFLTWLRSYPGNDIDWTIEVQQSKINQGLAELFVPTFDHIRCKKSPLIFTQIYPTKPKPSRIGQRLPRKHVWTAYASYLYSWPNQTRSCQGRKLEHLSCEQNGGYPRLRGFSQFFVRKSRTNL